MRGQRHPVGQHRGADTISRWSIVVAGLIVAGALMPVAVGTLGDPTGGDGPYDLVGKLTPPSTDTWRTGLWHSPEEFGRAVAIDAIEPGSSLGAVGPGPSVDFGKATDAEATVRRVLVGAPLDDRVHDGGEDVYASVFEQRSDGSWSEPEMLFYPGSYGNEGQGFGSAVDLDGDIAVVGSPWEWSEEGRAYVFERYPDGSWVPTAELEPPDGEAQFGRSVDVEGHRAVVGGYGRAWVYERLPDGSWEQTARLHMRLWDADVTPENFGRSVELDGDRILVGDTYHEGDSCPDDGWNCGAVFAFDLERVQTSSPTPDSSSDDPLGRWVLTDTLVPDDPAPGSGFGWDVDLDGDLAVVGAPKDCRESGEGCGVAYVFQRAADGTWRQVRRLRSTGSYEASSLGSAVGVEGGRVLVYAPAVFHSACDDGCSATFVYERGLNRSWTRVQNLTAPNHVGDLYESSMDTDTGAAVVGIVEYNSGCVSTCGQALVYDRIGDPAGSPIPPSFAARNVSGTLQGVTSMRSADIDGDRAPDVVVGSDLDGSIVWYSNDEGGLTEHVVTDEASGVRSVDPADLDRDGDTDIVAADGYDEVVRWYRQDDGGLTWTTETVAAQSNVRDAHVADVDGDGDLDVIAGGTLLDWYENREPLNRGFEERDVTPYPEDVVSLDAGDLDGDADLDIVAGTFGAVKWFENEGIPDVNDGSLERSFESHLVADGWDQIVDVGIGDLDGDGDPDLVAVDSSGVIVWYENQMIGGFTQHVVAEGVERPGSISLADVDRDLDPDLVVTFDRTVAWFENDRGDTFPRHVIERHDRRYPGPALPVDLDGDADVDLLGGTRSDGGLRLYEQIGPVDDPGLFPSSRPRG